MEAVAYILWEGGTQSSRLMQLTKEFLGLMDKLGMELCWCYLLGVVKVGADALLRAKQANSAGHCSDTVLEVESP